MIGLSSSFLFTKEAFMKTPRWTTLCIAIVLAAGLTTSCGSSTAKSAANVASKAGLAEALTASFGQLGSVLGSIVDVASGQAALPQLNKLNADVDDISKQAANLSSAEKKSLSDIVAAQLPPLKTALDKAYAVPGVRDVIQPSMDSLIAKYTKLQ
jgi:hypothetical protein